MTRKQMGTLSLFAIALIAMGYALFDGNFWVAALGAFFAVLLFVSFRNERRIE